MVTERQGAARHPQRGHDCRSRKQPAVPPRERAAMQAQPTSSAHPDRSQAAAAPTGAVLQAHRQRVAELDDALVRLQRMHDDAFELWCRIVKLAEGDAEDRNAQLDALHDEAYALADRITRLREGTFGAMNRESQLRLTSSVESVHSSLLHPEHPPLPGE